VNWGALAVGFLALALAGPLFKAAGTPGTGASRLGKITSLPAAVVSKFLDPTVPAIQGTTPPAKKAATPVALPAHWDPTQSVTNPPTAKTPWDPQRSYTGQ
jgi:hypothetical protein